MTDETIVSDVSDEVSEELVEEAVETVEETEQPRDHRQDAIEALVNGRIDELKEEVGEVASKDVEEIEQEEVKEDAAEEPTESETEPEPEKEQEVIVKIDGEEISLPLSKLVKGYQKEASGDRKLKQAADERLEIDRLRAEMFKAPPAEATPVEPKQEEQQLPDEGAEASLAEKIRDLYDDISVGSDSEVIAANKELQSLLSGRGTDAPAIQTEDIVSQAAQQVHLKMEYDLAHTQFADEYQDIVNDPTLLNMATNVLNEQIPNSRTYSEAFKKAGDQIREWKNGLTAKQDVSEDKLELKRQLQKEPVRASGRAERAPRKTESVSDIINSMRSSRGQ